MELSRRDLLAALGAAGASATAGCGALSKDDPVTDHDVDTLVAVARVVYPSEAQGVASFVREYSVARVRGDEDYARGVHDAVGTLDEYARAWTDAAYVDLGTDDRAELLDAMAVDDASPHPEGTDAERVRYYVANELLHAFYTTPTGASLAGLENPPGYPGGTTSYQRGPEQ